MAAAALPDSLALGPVRLRVADAKRSGEWLERVRQIESRALAKLRRAIDLADLDRENGEVVH